MKVSKSGPYPIPETRQARRALLTESGCTFSIPDLISHTNSASGPQSDSSEKRYSFRKFDAGVERGEFSPLYNYPAADLTQQARFARLKVAAGPAKTAGFVSRAEVAELADARGSGPRTRKGVGVRVPSSAPIFLQTNHLI
jgi:hypothetical protein